MIPRRQFLAGTAMTMGALAACGQRGERPANAGKVGQPLSAEDLEDALVGSSYLGCGGGGSLAEARALIGEDLAAGHSFTMIPVTDLRDDDRVACPYGLGSLAPTDVEMTERLANFPDPEPMPVEAAFRVLEQYFGAPFAGVILGEIGPLSMAEGLSIAARLGVPALDADTVGRAVPEINQHSVRVAGQPLTPTAVVTPFGDCMVLKEVRDPARGEEMIRHLTAISGTVGVADAPIEGRVAKRPGTLVTGSLSLAKSMGSAVREAKAVGEDPIEAARAAGGGYTLFHGRIAGFDWADEAGFLVGTMRLVGSRNFDGQAMVLQYKNEHLVASRNGDVVATCPDLITLIDRQTGEGITNPEFTTGKEVTVLGFRSDAIWRSDEGLKVFSPRYFGYDVDYRPIEDRLAL